ncbi:MAG: MFS transporter [Clostridiales bacterium]|jgi:GPH family glycoside/pentoside/hexuronide:cation symporter|nr:MFS transporter [Clostridiales bacterium]
MDDKQAAKKPLFERPLFNSRVKSANVKPKEILFGYFVGPFGALLSSGIFGAILNKYWTDVLFLGEMTSAATVFLTLLPLLSVVLVVIGNLLMGQILERTRTMQGKARPWLLLSAFALSAASVLMFIVPFPDSVGKMIWLAVSYNLFYAVAFPIYNTANSTMIPVSTRNGKQRGLLASANNIAALAVMGAGAMVFPILASMLLGSSQALWFAAICAVAVFGFAACLLQYYFTRERVTEETIRPRAQKEKIPLKKQVKAVAGDKTWWFVVVFWFLFQIGGAFQNVSMPYFSQWVADAGVFGGDWGVTMTALGIIGAVPMAAAVVFVWPLSNKFGKKNVAVAGLIIGAAGGVLAGLFPTNLIFVGVGIALQCLGAAPACYMILAMLADELDHLEAKNGFRCDGLTMSVYSLIAAVMTGIAMAAVNGVLGAAGYDARLADVSGAVQSDAVRRAITGGYIWARTAAFAIGSVLLLFFTVEKNLKSEQAAIAERQKAAILAQGGEWVEPEERFRLEREEADRAADEARIAELKERCKNKGLSFEEEERKYRARLAERQKRNLNR